MTCHLTGDFFYVAAEAFYSQMETKTIWKMEAARIGLDHELICTGFDPTLPNNIRITLPQNDLRLHSQVLTHVSSVPFPPAVAA
jgi:hypothetical protein